ncbi:hypothetical protein ARMSODRAFT_1079869 [Armillaria solidipes]|uniref:Uncharacterized protein n=1 Tax=Armillaria solidipes TaxID=1076256 RepID=A0A2H3C2Z6_9AGAR|nr:hypothetical protein ARMSODRAFT_1079869 [Armillaria solidipes]
MSTVSVPIELLSKIFVLAYDGDDITNAGFIDVCSYWRAVALATPELWSHVTVRNSGKGLSTILERSRSRPLTIRATLKDGPSFVARRTVQYAGPGSVAMGRLPRTIATSNASPSLHKILEILFSHSYHWSDVFLQLSPNLFHFLDDLKGPLPILKKLHLEMIQTADYLEDLPEVSSNAFAVAPQLTGLVIANIRGGVPFPMSNLRSVHLREFVTLEKMSDLLKEAPYLTKFVANRDRLSGHNGLGDGPPSHAGIPIVHTSLREMEFHRVRQVGDLLRSCVLPNLESFIFNDFFEFEDYQTIRSLSDCFAAWSPPLRKLSIRGIMPNEDVILLLRAVPTVQELIIAQTLDDDYEHLEMRFGELVARNLCAEVGLLPHLHGLDLCATTYPSDDVHDEWTGSIFADMIASRWTSSSQAVKLKHVRVGGYEFGFGSSVVERFESFKRQGLDISWVDEDHVRSIVRTDIIEIPKPRYIDMR